MRRAYRSSCVPLPGLGGDAVSDARPVPWMRAIRDAVPRFTTSRLAVLLCLGLRMNADGTGFASARQLGSDARVDERTARRATDEARGRGYLNRTRRGHRLGNDVGLASEWKLTLPVDNLAQPGTGARLSEFSTGQGCHLNRTETPSQPDTGVRPRGLYSGGLSAGARGRAEQTIKERTGATDEEAAAVAAAFARDRPDIRNLAAVLPSLADDEIAKKLTDVRTECHRKAVAAWLNWARQQPPCRHGDPGGTELHPTSGEPLCPQCRAIHRAAVA